MVIDESSRHAMFTRLQEVLGDEHARVLMEHLPPVGWADVATKHDLEAQRIALSKDIESLRAATKHGFAELEARLGLRFEALETRLDGRFENRLHAQTRTFVTWLIATMGALLVLAGLAIGSARFT